MTNLSPAVEPAPITAIVTAYRRTDQTVATLLKILNCSPPPSEVLVHVDGGESRCVKAIRDTFPSVNLLMSEENIGPGGGRNKLTAAAHNDWIASFDDDSYPLDNDYFARLQELAEAFPAVSIFSAQIFHRGETLTTGERSGQWVADFSGGACAYRRQVFLQTSGYVPLPVAYGMEEVDLAMRLHAREEQIFHTHWLRVFHDTTLERHQEPRITSASISNLALLTFLRYPISCWWIGFIQVIKRVLWLIEQGRRKGILSGLIKIPATLYTLRAYREIISHQAVKSYFMLRRSTAEKIPY